MSFLWEFEIFLLFSGTRLGVRHVNLSVNRSSRKMSQMTWIQARMCPLQ